MKLTEYYDSIELLDLSSSSNYYWTMHQLSKLKTTINRLWSLIINLLRRLRHYTYRTFKYGLPLGLAILLISNVLKLWWTYKQYKVYGSFTYSQLYPCHGTYMSMQPILSYLPKPLLTLITYINQPINYYFLRLFSKSEVYNVNLIRKQFQTMDANVKVYKSNRRNPHERAATIRNVARALIKRFGRSVPFYRYDLSGTNNWNYYFQTDIKSARKLDHNLSSAHFISLVDVDYYVDLPKIIASGYGHGLKALVLYTFDITEIYGNDEEARFWLENNQLVMIVPNGGCYKHSLWNFSPDNVLVPYGSGYISLFVDKLKITEKRMLVLLTIGGLISEPSNPILLSRLDFDRGSWNTHEYLDPSGIIMVSISHKSNPKCGVTLKLDTLMNVFSRASISKERKISCGSLESFLKADDVEDYKKSAAFLANWINQGFTYGNNDIVATIRPWKNINEVSYDLDVDGHLPGDPKVVGTGTCLVTNPNLAPTDGYASDESCYFGRFAKVKNTKIPHGRFKRYKNEFLNYLVPKPGSGLDPLSYEEMAEQLSRPEQVADWEKMKHFSSHLVLKKAWTIFLKSEAYDSVNFPRPISNPYLAFKFGYSRYVYPLADHIKKFAWYAFSKTPRSFSERVHVLAKDSNTVLSSDFSKFDGSHSKWMADLEKDVMKRFYSQKFHDDIEEIMSIPYQNHAFTKNQYHVVMEWARPSGSPDTSLFNTVINCFVAYCSYREDGKKHKEAVKCLGLYGGDDGLSFDVSQESFATVCKELGLTFTGELAPAELPLTFLGRIFPQPQESSTCVVDVLRCFKKLHIVQSNDRDPKELAMDKIFGYLSADKNFGFFSHTLTKLYDYYKRDVGEYDPIPNTYWGRESVLTNEVFPLDPNFDCDAEICRQLNLADRDLESLYESVNNEDFQEIIDTPPIVVKTPAVLTSTMVTPA
jgi:hypothetical protein